MIGSVPPTDAVSRTAAITAFLLMCALLAGCGGAGTTTFDPSPSPTPTSTPVATPTPVSTPTPVPTPIPSPTPTPPDHVFVVILENHGFSQVSNSPAMPFLNSLAARNALAANYFANTHPSIGNYFMLTAGVIESNDDNFQGTISADNIVRALSGAGKTWKGYFQSLPSPGYIGGDVLPYVKHHNPFAYFTDVIGSSAEMANIVPVIQFFADINSGSLPNFALIVPDLQNDAHDCPAGKTTCTDDEKLAAADGWLQNNLGPLMANSAFGNSLLIITWDEGISTDTANGGGQIFTVLVGARVKSGFQASTLYQHQDLLRTILQLLNVSDFPNNAAGAKFMGEFFQ